MAKKIVKKAPVGRIDDMEAKRKALDVAMAHLEKDFGSGTIMRLGDDSVQDVEVIPTGSIGLDYALGVGGLPRGRITEIYGPESSGKTTLAIHVIAEAQKMGGICAIVDAEHAFDRFYAEKLGVDVNNLWIAQPDNGEQALDIAEQLINSGAIDVLVVDSVAALTPKAEIEGEMGDKNVGLHARLMSQAMRKLTGTIAKTRTCCIFINQIREKIGVMFGNPETTTGGNALKFYSSVRLEIRSSGFIKDGEQAIGRTAKVKVVKNKVAPPFMKAEFELMFGEGISRVGEIVDLGVENGIIQKSGAWFSYNGSKLGQGRDAVKRVLKENKELADELADKITEKMNADREARRPMGNPFLPSEDSRVVKSEDEGMPEIGDSDAPDTGEDLFGDDFAL
ncbi:MAG: recombinase RecA [Muribaculaceae bacterium]|nr:recombinase RecA [Muribaculaceae bacterium]